MELRILNLGACGELQIISREIKWDLLTPTGLHFGSSKLSIFSFLDLRGTSKICYNYIKKGERKKTFTGFAQWFSSNLSMRLSGENERRGKSALFCYQTFATKKTRGFFPLVGARKISPQKLGLDLPLYSII